MSRRLSRRELLIAAGGIALLPAGLGGHGDPVHRLTGEAMGSRYRVVVRGVHDRHLVWLNKSVDRTLAYTDELMSPFRAMSELSRFNEVAGTSWMEMSERTVQVLETALEVRRLSDRAYEPAAGVLVDHWGFGPAPRAVLSPEVPEAWLRLLADGEIEVEGTRVRKSHADLRLDLNGIAKGDAVDRVSSWLQRQGLPEHLIELGGEIRVGSKPGSEHAWRVGIEHPRGGLLQVVSLEHGAVATSGDYLSHYELGGKRYSHILDPVTGCPIEHNLGLVTVVADTACAADAWATALMVMGPEKGLALARARGMAVLMLARTTAGWDKLTTPAMDLLTVEEMT